jgi:pimeloyl-ACP methyl ester carboxylesterase
MSNDPQDRRGFLHRAALTFAAARLGRFGAANRSLGVERSRAPRPPQTPFGPVKQIDAGLLNVGYVEMGPAGGRAVVLLHGWPYDIHSYAEVAPLLAAKGYRVIVPYLRGFGSTRFRAADTFRNAQQSVVALDVKALMDSLKIDKAIIGGFDWGSRTADIMAALWPERCKAIVAVSGYLITNVEAQKQPLPPEAEHGWWYQYYFNTDRGQRGYAKYTHDFNKLIWTLASPTWHFDDATFDRTAQSFNNPDHVAIVVHNYRWRQGLAKGEAQYDSLEQKLFTTPVITVPAITISSDFDGAAASGDAYAKLYTARYSHRILKGVGHNVPQEAPQAFASAIVDVDGY